jgi:hypothetical protein
VATAQRSGFLQGLGAGVAGTLLVGAAVLYSLHAGDGFDQGPPVFRAAAAWVYANLGLSLPVFALLAMLYVSSLRRLKRALAEGAAVETVAQIEQMVDTWTNLFFGVGVIWTAIGMRSALIQALGDPANSLDLGAYAVLERLVEGGILLALSTTIFGGVGGYLMRVIKALTVETDLRRHYNRLAHAPSEEVHATLQTIEAHVQRLAQIRPNLEESNHDQAGVALPAAQRNGQQ